MPKITEPKFDLGALLSDNKQLDSFISKTKDLILYQIRKIGGTEEDAKESHAEAICILLNLHERGKLDIQKSVYAYLKIIASRLFIKSRRNFNTKTLPDVPLDNIEIEAIDEEIIVNERKIFIQKKIESLGKVCKELLNFCWSYPKPDMETVAKQFNWSNENVASVRKNECINRFIELVKSDPTYKQYI